MPVNISCEGTETEYLKFLMVVNTEQRLQSIGTCTDFLEHPDAFLEVHVPYMVMHLN